MTAHAPQAFNPSGALTSEFAVRMSTQLVSQLLDAVSPEGVTATTPPVLPVSET